jgi:hypothetical protein
MVKETTTIGCRFEKKFGHTEVSLQVENNDLKFGFPVFVDLGTI